MDYVESEMGARYIVEESDEWWLFVVVVVFKELPRPYMCITCQGDPLGVSRTRIEEEHRLQLNEEVNDYCPSRSASICFRTASPFTGACCSTGIHSISGSLSAIPWRALRQ